MLDNLLYRQFDSVLAPVGSRLSTTPPLGWTLAALASVLAAVAAVGHQAYLMGAGLLVLGRVLDAVGGAVARAKGATVFGRYLSEVLDRLGSAAVPFGFALAMPERALAAMFLIFGLLAQVAAERPGGVPAPRIGRMELLIAYVLACLFPGWFSIVAYAVGIACFVSAGSRVAAAAS